MDRVRQFRQRPGHTGRPRHVLALLNEHSLGGTQINAVDLAASLPTFGYQCHLFVYAGRSRTAAGLEEYAADREVSLGLLKRPATIPAAARLLADVAAKINADLVHVYGNSVMMRDAYWGPAALGRRPLVMTIYDMVVAANVPSHQPIVVGTGYQYEAESSSKRLSILIRPPVDTDRDHPNRVDPSDFIRSFGLTKDRLRIVVVSRLDEVMKARPIEHAMLAVRDLSSSGHNVELVVVGGGNAEQRLRGLAESINSGLSDRRIIMTGALSNPRPAYASADILIGMGGSAARAAAFGRPLVVSGEAGWYRTFSPETASLLLRNSFWSSEVSPAPVAELSSCLRPLIQDPQLRHQLGSFGRDVAVSEFSLQAMALRTSRMYEALLARRHPTFRWLSDVRDERGWFWQDVRTECRLTVSRKR